MSVHQPTVVRGYAKVSKNKFALRNKWPTTLLRTSSLRIFTKVHKYRFSPVTSQFGHVRECKCGHTHMLLMLHEVAWLMILVSECIDWPSISTRCCRTRWWMSLQSLFCFDSVCHFAMLVWLVFQKMCFL